MNEEKSIQNYLDELIMWNRKINLIGRQTDNIHEEHLRDSLYLLPYIQQSEFAQIIDIGSGGGFPAIPLSIYCPTKYFILTDVVDKKIVFLDYIIHKLKLNATAVKIQPKSQFPMKSLIISRAYSTLFNIVEWAKIHAPESSEFYLLKGRQEIIQQELKEIQYHFVDITEKEKGSIVHIKL